MSSAPRLLAKAAGEKSAAISRSSSVRCGATLAPGVVEQRRVVEIAG
jgi:hypothetical protein